MSHASWDSFRERVRDANPLVEICEAYGSKCVRKGRNRMRCSSPYRSDRTPSFDIYTHQELWRDHGTQAHGDVFDLIGLIEGITEHRAQVDFLADRVGLSYGTNGSSKGGGIDMNDPEFRAKITKRIERRYVEQIATDAAMYYHDCLPANVRRHLNDHYGFENDFVDSMMMGWSDGTLFAYLRDSKGYVEKDILKTGLFIRTPHRIIEHHELRITFPYWRQGKAAYMIGRRLEGVTPDTDYQKSKYKKTLVRKEDREYVSRHVKNILFGLDTIRKKSKVLTSCEGVTDALTAIACGYPCLSAVTVKYKDVDIEQLERHCDNFEMVVIINDHEALRNRRGSNEIIQPGLDGAEKTAKYLWEHGHDVRVAILPREEGVDKIDVNEFVRNKGKNALDKVVQTALPYPEFLIWRVPQNTRPVELGEKLSPIYAVIARCKAIEREAYVNKICERFGLTKGTVEEDLAEFLRDSSNVIPPPPRVPTVPSANGAGDPPPNPPFESPPSSGGEGGGGSMPPGTSRDNPIHGAVFEHEDGYYYTYKKEGKGEPFPKRISNFVLNRKKLVRVEDGERTCCDIRAMNGLVKDNVILRANTFNSRDFANEMQRLSNELTWTGTGANVGGLVELLLQRSVPIHHGVDTLGLIETSNGPRWIMPDYVLGPSGIVKNSEYVYAPRFEASIAPHLDYSGAHSSDDDIRPLAQKVMSNLFKLNTPEVILAMVGWFYATPVAPIIRRVLRHMPSFWLWGTQGCGKSSLACDIFWPILGVLSNPLSCLTTKFIFINRLSAIVSIPQLIDEFKTDLAITQQQMVIRFIRQTYKGEDDERGQSNLSWKKYPVLAPMCLIGEMMPTESALLERIICASPLKTTLNEETEKAYCAIRGQKNLQLLGGHYIKWVMGRDIEEDINTARALMHSVMLPTLTDKVPPRVIDSMLIVVLGDFLHRKWCEHLGLTIKNRPRVRDHFTKIVAAVTESEDGGGVKDGFDRFLESLSAYAHLGIIQEHIHYTVVKGHLCLHLASCYEVYLAERRKRGQPDGTNGTRALKRILREKRAASTYVVELSRQIWFKDPIKGKRQVRAVIIDTSLLPENLDIEDFPVSVNRTRSTHETHIPGFGFN